jgi:hypothetical protein
MSGMTQVGNVRIRLILAALALCAIGPGLAACDPVPPDFCPHLAGLDVWTFDGQAGTDAYGNPVNWDHDGNSNVGIPGERNDPADADDEVCIPPNKTVTVPDGGSSHLVVLDNAGTLKITPGAKLELKGDPDTQPSYSHNLVLRGMLFGRGKLTTRSAGTLTWNHASGSGAATMTTRENFATNTPLPVPPDPGRTVIAPGGTLLITGLGVNLFDRRIIDNRGTTRVTGSGTYIAADYGTTFRNSGTFTFEANGDYVQGFVRGYAALGRSRFINTGTLRKTGGTGTSVVDAQYTATEGPDGPGSIVVSSGTLNVVGTAVRAQVDPGSNGAAVGNGGCGANAGCSAPSASASDPQFESVSLPGGTDPSSVKITERAPDGSTGVPVDVSIPSESATATTPMTFTFVLDDSVLGAGDTHLTLAVTHNGAAVPDCTGAPQASCVDRSASSTTAGDVHLVVRTATNGRWRIL